jgi:hypothetical protein
MHDPDGQVSLDGQDEDGPVNQKVAQVIKEGYMRKKKPGNSKIQDLKRTWERRYFVLYNDGKLKYYDSRAKRDEKGSLDLRFFSLQVELRPERIIRCGANVVCPCSAGD